MCNCKKFISSLLSFFHDKGTTTDIICRHCCGEYYIVMFHPLTSKKTWGKGTTSGSL